VDVISVVALSMIAGGGLIGLWMIKEEEMGAHLKLLLTGLGSALFATTLGLTVPALQGAGPVHEAMTFVEVLVAIATSSLALAVLGGGALGGIVVGYLIDRSRKSA
jgi:hypothetical protein